MDHLADAPIANILILAGIIFLAVGLFGRIGGFIGSIFGNIEAGKNSRVLAGVLGAILIVGGGWLHEDSHKSVASNPPSPAPVSTTPSATNTAPAVTPAVTPDVTKDVSKANISTPQLSQKKTPAVVAAPTLAAERENLKPSAKPPVVDDRLVGTWTNLTLRSDSIKRLEIARVGQGLNVHLWYACPEGECDRGFHRLDTSGSSSTYEHADSNRRRLGSLNLHAPGVLLVTVDILEPGTTHHWHNNWIFVKSTAEKVQAAFTRYLGKPDPKAFAMAPGGLWSYQYSGASDEAVKQKALRHCEQSGAPGCRVILLNDDPVE